MATITIQTRAGSQPVPTVWQGAHLSVHRPPNSKAPGGLSTAPRHWAITHTALGLACCASFDGPKARAIALAQLWDSAFAEIKEPADAGRWRFRKTWGRDCQIAQHGTAEPDGPILPDNPTGADVAHAMARAISGADPLPDSEPIESDQFPARETVAADRLRNGADGLELRWRGKWWPVPTLGEVEAWALFDGTAETPDGRTVEPDHPESWTVLLGVV